MLLADDLASHNFVLWSVGAHPVALAHIAAEYHYFSIWLAVRKSAQVLGLKRGISEIDE